MTSARAVEVTLQPELESTDPYGWLAFTNRVMSAYGMRPDEAFMAQIAPGG